MKTSEELVYEYGLEIGIDGLTLEQLIESHRTMEKSRKSFEAEVKNAAERAYNEVLDATYISLEKLRKMKVKDLVILLSY